MGVREQYEASQLDLERIRRYARKVAKAKGPFPNGEYLLESRSFTRTEEVGVRLEEYEERISYVLTNDGRLLRKCTYWTDVTFLDGRSPAYQEEGRGGSSREFCDRDVELFDHERRHKTFRAHGARFSTDREPGHRVLHHAKGVGLSKRLKKIYESRGD